MTFQDWVGAIRRQFPQLTAANSRPTSPFDEGYNCIAWAAEDTEHWWWPDAMGLNYWPDEVPREETVEAFIRAYELQGYVRRSDATLEAGTEKVAIYVGSNGRPTHASRQLRDGWWASKLGPQIDIEHEFEALDGPVYGSVAVVLARPAKQTSQRFPSKH